VADLLTPADEALGRRIGQLADAGTRDRDPLDVARRASGAAARRAAPFTRRRLAPALVGLAAVLVVGAVGLRILGAQQGSYPATAWVGGVEYATTVARSIRLDGVTLTPHGPATRNTSPVATVDDVAYRIAGVDPAKVLVMRLAPVQADDVGLLGGYLLLVRTADWALQLCPYFAPDDELRPRACR
jgi:hypothetical protein